MPLPRPPDVTLARATAPPPPFVLLSNAHDDEEEEEEEADNTQNEEARKMWEAGKLTPPAGCVRDSIAVVVSSPSHTKAKIIIDIDKSVVAAVVVVAEEVFSTAEEAWHRLNWQQIQG